MRKRCQGLLASALVASLLWRRTGVCSFQQGSLKKTDMWTAYSVEKSDCVIRADAKAGHSRARPWTESQAMTDWERRKQVEQGVVPGKLNVKTKAQRQERFKSL